MKIAVFKSHDEKPTLNQLEEWVYEGISEAIDGCSVEPDGECMHGYPSWLIKLGII